MLLLFKLSACKSSKKEFEKLETLKNQLKNSANNQK